MQSGSQYFNFIRSDKEIVIKNGWKRTGITGTLGDNINKIHSLNCKIDVINLVEKNVILL